MKYYSLISIFNSLASYNETIAVIILVNEAISQNSFSYLLQSCFPLIPSKIQYVLQDTIGKAYKFG